MLSSLFSISQIGFQVFNARVQILLSSSTPRRDSEKQHGDIFLILNTQEYSSSQAHVRRHGKQHISELSILIEKRIVEEALVPIPQSRHSPLRPKCSLAIRIRNPRCLPLYQYFQPSPLSRLLNLVSWGKTDRNCSSIFSLLS